MAAFSISPTLLSKLTSRIIPNMIARISSWFQRHFSDPQVVILALFLVLGVALVLMFGRMLTPVLASLIIAYLLEGPVQRLEGFG